MDSLGYTKEGFPVFPGETVWEPQQVRLKGHTLRKHVKNEEGEEVLTDTFIPGKLIWQPVEVTVQDSLPSLPYRRHYDCHTYCQSLNIAHDQSHVKMQQDQ
jgi:hypothetical protein